MVFILRRIRTNAKIASVLTPMSDSQAIRKRPRPARPYIREDHNHPIRTLAPLIRATRQRGIRDGELEPLRRPGVTLLIRHRRRSRSLRTA